MWPCSTLRLIRPNLVGDPEMEHGASVPGNSRSDGPSSSASMWRK
jgi:hypothetical protein